MGSEDNMQFSLIGDKRFKNFKVFISCENKFVEADIKADRVLIRGKVKGNVHREKLIFVTASGSLDGDIITQKVVLEPGSDFSGKCTMVKK